MIGLDSALSEYGIEIEAVSTSDFLYNARGGREKDGTILGNFDLTFELDTQRAGGWENGTFFLYALGNWNSGGFASDFVGDLQVTSNIEASQAVRLYEAWYEHRFASDRLSLLIGLHDLNSEFSAIEYGSMFVNSSFGIGADIAQTTPSIFPTTALALRARIQPTADTYFLASVYDGIPGDPSDSKRTTIKLSKDDGIFAVLETGWEHGEAGSSDYYKLGIGSWLHTAEVENFDGEFHDRNFGVYLIGEKTLYSEAADGQGLGAFVQFGYADENRNQLAYYWGAGLRYVGLIPGRDRDEFGVAVASAWNGDEFIRFTRAVESTPVERTETVIEAAYRAEILPGFVLQPDLQYVINPSMDPSLDNALQLGIRVEMSF
ncbi:MAG: carbohydrate porin [Deltaproteobacteria bacterium]|jgi:porin|nr:carbohydrate porin [Deltaproteobacteria bacterium]